MSISCLAILSCRCILNTRQPCSRHWSSQSLGRKMNSKSWLYQSPRSLLATRTMLGSRSNIDTRDLGQNALLSTAAIFLWTAIGISKESSGRSLWILSQLPGHLLGMNPCGRWALRVTTIFCSYFVLFVKPGFFLAVSYFWVWDPGFILRLTVINIIFIFWSNR